MQSTARLDYLPKRPDIVNSMGMFDYYEPAPAIHCPACNAELKEWQGKDGLCLLINAVDGWMPLERRTIRATGLALRSLIWKSEEFKSHQERKTT